MTYEQPRGSFDMGRIMQRTFSVLGENLGQFAALAFICVAVPQGVIAALSLFLAQAAGQGGATEGVYLITAALGLVGGIASMVGAYLLEAGVLYAAVSGMNGRKVTLGQMVSTGFGFILPLFGLGILMGLALVLGFALLLVPGIIMAVAWIAAAPAIVIERKGITESFGRSADLTRNHRWAIFALCLIYSVVYMAITFVVMALTGGLTAAVGATSDLASLGAVTNILISPLVSAALTLIGITGVAAIYFELRSSKEGVGARELAAVFE